MDRERWGERKETSDLFVPTQADLFRSIGEKLSMAQGRGREEKGGREREKGKKLMKEDNAQKVVARKKYETKEVPQSAPLPPPSLALSFHLSTGKSLRDVRGQHLVDTRGRSIKNNR
jgi:hypothetical protein